MFFLSLFPASGSSDGKLENIDIWDPYWLIWEIKLGSLGLICWFWFWFWFWFWNENWDPKVELLNAGTEDEDDPNNPPPVPIWGCCICWTGLFPNKLLTELVVFWLNIPPLLVLEKLLLENPPVIFPPNKELWGCWGCVNPPKIPPPVLIWVVWFIPPNKEFPVCCGCCPNIPPLWGLLPNDPDEKLILPPPVWVWSPPNIFPPPVVDWEVPPPNKEFWLGCWIGWFWVWSPPNIGWVCMGCIPPKPGLVVFIPPNILDWLLVFPNIDIKFSNEFNKSYIYFYFSYFFYLKLN